MDKRIARERGLQARRSLSFKEKERLDTLITAKTISRISSYESIGCYVSLKDEVSTKAILKWCFLHHKTVAVPKTMKHTLQFQIIHSFEDLKPGVFHLLEPMTGNVMPVSNIACMVVPLSAYDSQCHRTGYGKGYYDSVLKECQRKIGIAYSCQKVDCIDVDQWDITLDEVVSESIAADAISRQVC